jgi:hypothetical protein
MVGQTSAATKKAKEPASVIVSAKPAKQPSERGQTPPNRPVKKSSVPVVMDRQQEAIQKQAKPVSAERKSASPKSPVPAAPEHQPAAIQKQAKPVSAERKPASPKSSVSTATERQPEAIQKQAKPVSAERKPTSPKGPVPAVTERQPETSQKQAEPVPTELKPASPKSPRGMKVHKKETLKAVVEPRTDLMYHGMLESPQRYDPRRNHHVGAGVPDPQNPELTLDHFQELDHNQDGSIDPVERVFGRLDMDRDFHDRRPR